MIYERIEALYLCANVGVHMCYSERKSEREKTKSYSSTCDVVINDTLDSTKLRYTASRSVSSSLVNEKRNIPAALNDVQIEGYIHGQA